MVFVSKNSHVSSQTQTNIILSNALLISFFSFKHFWLNTKLKRVKRFMFSSIMYPQHYMSAKWLTLYIYVSHVSMFSDCLLSFNKFWCGTPRSLLYNAQDRLHCNCSTWASNFFKCSKILLIIATASLYFLLHFWFSSLSEHSNSCCNFVLHLEGVHLLLTLILTITVWIYLFLWLLLHNIR